MQTNRHYIDERTFVEDPLLQQLEGLGWQVLRLKSPSDGVQYPEESWRENFSQVTIKPKLVEALKLINPWLQDDQVEEVFRKLTTYSAGSLLENNKNVLELLLGNTSVAENRQTGQKSVSAGMNGSRQATRPTASRNSTCSSSTPSSSAWRQDCLPRRAGNPRSHNPASIHRSTLQAVPPRRTREPC